MKYTARHFIFFITGAFLFLGSWNHTAHAATDPWSSIPVRPEHTRPAEIHTWNANLSAKTTFTAFDRSATGGGEVTTGDIDGNGQDELVVGTGPGRDSLVSVYTEGKRLLSFTPYAKGFRGGVRVAAADVDGDGKAEIVTAPGPGITPTVKIYWITNGTVQKEQSFAAYSKKFLGGVHIVAGDIDGDGKAEIVTAPGPGGGPHVIVFDGTTFAVKHEFFPFDGSMTDGVTLSLARTPKGPSLVTSAESWATPIVKRYLFEPTPVLAAEFLVSASDNRNGVTTAAFDLDHDGYDEISVTQNGGTTPDATFFDIYGTRITSMRLLDDAYRGGLSLAQIHPGNNAPTQLAVMPIAPVVTGPTASDKFIDVNLSQQRLYAYEHGRIARSFLISSGTRKYPTPIAKTTVSKKIPIMDYRWSYGPNHPDNYNVKNVRFNLNILPHIYIHSAYWHHNFGHRMSHGCINTSIPDAQWIYNWTPVGTPVETHL